MAWMTKLWVVSAVILAAFVCGTAAVSPAVFPPPPCTGNSPSGTGPQSVCSYIQNDKLGKLGATPDPGNLADKRKCCDSFVPIDVTTCSAACQRSVTSVSCSLACTPLNAADPAGNPKICSKDVIDLYSNCYSCTAFSNALPKRIPQPTSTSTDVLAATALQWWSTTGAGIEFLTLPPTYPRTLLGESQCTPAYTSTCVPTKVPEISAVAVSTGGVPGTPVPKVGTDYNVPTAAGPAGTKVSLVATATGLGCTPTDLPSVRGRWEVKVGDKVLVELAEDVWTPDWSADGDKFKTKPKEIYLFTSDGLDTKYTVTFTATNSFGTSVPTTFNLVQKTAAQTDTIINDVTLCSRAERVGLEKSGTVLVKTTPTAATLSLVLANVVPAQKRCSLIGTDSARTTITQAVAVGCDQADAARIAHCTIIPASLVEATYAPKCTDDSRVILQNVQLTAPTQMYFGCVQLINSGIGKETIGDLFKVSLAVPTIAAYGTAAVPLAAPARDVAFNLDSTSVLVLNGIVDPLQTVYVFGTGTLYIYKGTYNGKLVVGDKVNVVYRESDPFLGAPTPATFAFTTFGNNVNLKTDAAGAFKITCEASTKIKGNFNANTGDPTKVITLSGCVKANFPASHKFLTTAGLGECGLTITSGCNGNTVPVHLFTAPPPRRCFIVGDGSNTDAAKCTAVTQAINADISIREIATQGTDNGGIDLQLQAKMLFYNVAPDFGAYWTPGTDAIPNKFSPDARLEVVLSPSVDKGNVVNIPLIFCGALPPAVPAVTEAGCCDAIGNRPTLEVVNADGRLYTLLCATGTQVTKALFPSIFKTAATAAPASVIGVLYLQLQPKVTATTVSSGIVPGYTSASTYCVNLDQNPAIYTADAFRSDVLSTLSIQSEFFDVTSYARNNDNQAFIRACFVCKDLSNTAQADARCVDIRNKILFDTTLNSKTKARSDAGTEVRNASTGTGSNSALYALFALAIIPVLLFFAICLFVMNKTRKADNQYAQDTSTFSTVAAQPYPAYGKDLYPSTPIAYA